MAGRQNQLDEALSACAAGREDGLDAILAIEGRQLMGVAYRMLGRQELAQEAVQDAMVQVWRKAAQLRGGSGSGRGWLYAILRNRCRNILRDERRMSVLSPADLAQMQEARQGLVQEEGWETLAGSERLLTCLKALDERSREAILLAHVAGFSHGEISARQGVPLGTAKSWIRRGLSALRECLS